jgi:hypothetical protein
MGVYDELFPDGSKLLQALHPAVKAICALADEVRALRQAIDDGSELREYARIADKRHGEVVEELQALHAAMQVPAPLLEALLCSYCGHPEKWHGHGHCIGPAIGTYKCVCSSFVRRV